MRDKSGHIAAPVPMELNGKTYILSPLTLSDFKELERFLQDDALDSVMPQIERLAKSAPEAAKHLLDKAHAESLSRKIGTTVFSLAAQSINGGTYMLWLALRKKQPELSREACIEMLTMENTAEVMAKVNMMAGFKQEDDEAPFTTAQ